MAQIDEKQIEEIVSQVLRTLQQDRPAVSQPIGVATGASSSRAGVFGTVAEAIARSENITSGIGQTWVCKETRDH